MSEPLVSDYRVLTVVEDTHIRRVRSWRDASGLHVDVRRVVPGGAGVCQRCGCSAWDACPGGCAWVDTERTICSRCASWLITRMVLAMARVR